MLNMQNNSIDKKTHLITEKNIVGCEVICKIQLFKLLVTKKSN